MPTILIIDDQVEVREILRKMLGAENLEAETVPDSAQALAKLESRKFDLVVLDIKLKEDSGLRVLKKIRETGKDIRVVVYSGFVTAELEKEAMQQGADDVLNKSLGPTSLITQIKQILKSFRKPEFQKPEKRKRSILILDDQAEIRNLLKRFFESRDFDVLLAANGAEAIRITETLKPDVALIDINLPDMSGISVLKRLKKNHPELGMVIMTGNPADEKIEDAIQAGTYSYVLKPLDLDYLELVVLSKIRIAS